ncbi:3561_t:CDS:2, partial [Dentiscutata heterogama]
SEKNLTDEEVNIKKKFNDADSIIKEISMKSLKSLSVNQYKYYSKRIDVQNITNSLKEFYSGSTVVSLTSDLSQSAQMQTPKSEYSNFSSNEEKLPKNFEGSSQSSQRSQSYTGSTLVLSTNDLSQLIPMPKSEHLKFSSDEEKSRTLKAKRIHLGQQAVSPSVLENINFDSNGELKKVGLGDHNAPLLIADIKTYDDGTILVHIIRNESTQSVNCSKIGGMSLEQKLRIRLIFSNGSVKAIDPNLNLDPINYCLLNNNNSEYKINKLNNIITYLNDTKNNILHNLVNPITIYPLRKPFILVTYVKTNDSSNLATYKECGEVIDWDGISRSLTILSVLNIGITDSDTQYFLMSTVSTIDGGYLAIFRYTQENNNNSLVSHSGLCTMFIFYNQTSDHSHAVNIYQIPQPNITINSVDCDVSYIYITCIVSIYSDNTTYIVQIILLSSGNIAQLDLITNQTQQGLRAKIMPFGGYILDVTTYDNNDDNTYCYIYIYNGLNKTLNSSNHFLTNYFSANTITQNNTFLLASPSTNDNNSWSLLNIPILNYSTFNG